jgi:hypothetical protein
MEELFKTLVFTDERVSLGKYVHIDEQMGIVELCGISMPKLYPKDLEWDGIKKYYKGIDFEGVELITISIKEVE